MSILSYSQTNKHLELNKGHTCRLMISALQLRISCMMDFFLYSQLRAQEGQ